MTHDELVARACAWLAGPMKMHCVVPELTTWATREIPDVIAWRALSGHLPGRSNVASVVVECKTSRSDFLADRAKPFRRQPSEGMGRYRWYFAPAGLLTRDDLPECWGLAECGPRGVRKIAIPLPFANHNADAETGLLVAGLRRVCFPNLRFPPVHYVHRETETARGGLGARCVDHAERSAAE